ncbi:hypothetical protein ACWD4K_26040 [Streptomyces gelaticus]
MPRHPAGRPDTTRRSRREISPARTLATLVRRPGRAELHVRPGACHGFDGLAPRAALGRDAGEARTRWPRRLLAQSGRGKQHRRSGDGRQR